jgi:hypothetical protein
MTSPDLESRARSNIGAFARMVGEPLTRPQAESVALNTSHRFVVIVAPRQGGKSRALALRAVQWAFAHAAHRVLIISAGEASARALLTKALRVITGSPLLRSSLVEEQAALIRLSNGSEIRSVPASEAQVRGHTVDLLLIDEAAMVSDDLILGAAVPTTAARSRHARIVLASSANRADGVFYDLAARGEAGDPHVVTHRWGLAECPWISASMVEAARASMSAARFAAEYEGVFASGENALLSRSLLSRVVMPFRLHRLPDLRGPARLASGVDWGASYDRSAFAAVARVPQGGPRTFAVVCAQAWPSGTSNDDVIADIVASPAHLDKMTSESIGVGVDPTTRLFRRYAERDAHAGGGPTHTHTTLSAAEYLRWYARTSPGRLEQPDPNLMPKPFPGEQPRESFHTALRRFVTRTENKAAAYASLRSLIESRALLIPADATELIRELLMLRVEVLQHGERIEAKRGHDDLADALAFALTPHNASGQWSTWIGDLADPRARVPEPSVAVPVLDRLPPEPVLQSIQGPHLTLPPGVDLTAPREPTAVEKATRASQEARRKDVRA